ncbi:hypothetical protein TYRP_007806 [Tyrophagus putrescentiae]|nr:hypothetical protein TYRP_007806 [Tyrophagus putrescentiae]
MNVQVDAFNEEHRLLVQPTVTIGHLLEHLLTKKLGLLPATRPLDLFGLQVLNERHQAVREGMAFQPMAIRFRLRAHAFPPSLEAVREDRAALELLYRQAEAKLLKAAEKLKKVKVNSSKKEDENLSPPQPPLMDPALLTTLVALSMVVDYGSFVVASSSSSSSKDAQGAEDFPWVEEAKARAAALGACQPNNAEGAMSDAQAILAMWRLFGLMTAAEAQYNYLSLLASSEEYSVEAVRFAVWPLFSNVKEVQGMAKMKKKEGGQKVEESVAEVRLAVSYQGVEVITKKVKNKSNVDLEQPIIEESSLVLDWSAVSCFENHKRTLTIKLAKQAEEEEEDDDWTVFAGKPGQKKKKEKKKIVLAASSTYEAHLIYLLITAYHGEHRRRVWRSEFNGGGGGNGAGNGNGLQMEGITTEARFVLPQPENFFGQILAGMVQLEELKTQVKALQQQQQQKLQEVKMKGNDLQVDNEGGNEEEVSQQPVDETSSSSSSSSSSISLYKDIEGMGNVVLVQKANAAEEVSAELLGILPNAKSSGAPISMAEEEEEVDEVNALLALASSNNKSNKISGNNSESSESGDDLLSADDMLSADKAHLLNFPKLTFKVKTLGNKKAAAAEEGDALQVKAEKIGGASEEEFEGDEDEEDETAITAESAEELESGPSSSSCSALITSYTTSSTTSTTTTSTA